MFVISYACGIVSISTCRMSFLANLMSNYLWIQSFCHILCSIVLYCTVNQFPNSPIVHSAATLKTSSRIIRVDCDCTSTSGRPLSDCDLRMSYVPLSTTTKPKRKELLRKHLLRYLACFGSQTRMWNSYRLWCCLQIWWLPLWSSQRRKRAWCCGTYYKFRSCLDLIADGNNVFKCVLIYNTVLMRNENL